MNRLFVVLLGFAAAAHAQDNAVPAPVTPAQYADLIERPPFRRHLSLSESLVLSGVARLSGRTMVTVWNRASGESFMVTGTPNPQGWRLVSLAEGADLKNVSATIASGSQEITLRFDPDRLIPPKLDNTSRPGRLDDRSLAIEALLRTLEPEGAKAFEALDARSQEKFRKAFGNYLAAYPTASSTQRTAFIRRELALGDPAPKAPGQPGTQAINTPPAESTPRTVPPSPASADLDPGPASGTVEPPVVEEAADSFDAQ